MEIGQLAEIIEEIPSQGISLSQIERIRIQCSLRLLQNQMKSESMYFLGKVLALHRDYYLAFSTEANKYMPSIFYCSQDATTWFSLAGVAVETRDEALMLQTPLTGTLTSEFTLPSGRIVSEEIRLASIVSDLTENCILVPRGFILQTALGFVLANPMWVGIPLEKCRKMSNIRHWKPRVTEMTLLDKSLGNPALDFIEPITDLSEWTFGDNEGVHMKSLRWPGFEFSLNGTRFANMFFGFGIKAAESEVAGAVADVTGEIGEPDFGAAMDEEEEEEAKEADAEGDGDGEAAAEAGDAEPEATE